MNSIERLKAALARADELVLAIVNDGSETLDKIEERRQELEALDKSELIELLIKAEKVKSEKPFTIEKLARPLLEDETLAIFTYDQIASTIRKHVPAAKTSAKGIASYVQTHKDDWSVVPRERFKLDLNEVING